MKYYLSLLLMLSSCTYNITLVHTEGVAKDVVDETDTVDPTISPNISIPV